MKAATSDDDKKPEPTAAAAPKKADKSPPVDEVKVGETGTTEPVDENHSIAAVGASADAPAPVLAEHLPNPGDAYKQDPPPAQVGAREAKEPPSVIVGGAKPPVVDARGDPVHPPRPENDYQSGTASSD